MLTSKLLGIQIRYDLHLMLKPLYTSHLKSKRKFIKKEGLTTVGEKNKKQLHLIFLEISFCLRYQQHLCNTCHLVWNHSETRTRLFLPFFASCLILSLKIHQIAMTNKTKDAHINCVTMNQLFIPMIILPVREMGIQ